ncbi:MAG: thiamine phosphate synthase [Oscillospiraceae bacterium]|nr:thiamine phosphate synthase [Oscillospiraceae bacterium]
MFNPEIICITQSSLFDNISEFLNQTEKICKGNINRIILREKHLTESEYFKLAVEVKNICIKYNIPFTVHNFLDIAENLECEYFHCPFSLLKDNINRFKYTGVSVHSESEARNAEKLGAFYITAGHVFETQCKAGLKPRGTDFINQICNSVNIPVYAIGGINSENIYLLKDTGIKGVCLMSSLMKSENPEKYIEELKINMADC